MRFRTILLTALAFGAKTVGGLAQPVLTPDNTVAPLIGSAVTVTEFEVSSANNLADQLVAGENVTWDFTVADFAEPIEQMLRYHEPPFTDIPASDRAEFADADFVQEVVGDLSADFPEEALLYFFSAIDDEGITNFGFSGLVDTNDDGFADTTALTYTPFDLQLPFPTTYGDSWQSAYVQTFHLVDQSFSPGVATVAREVVGWGTLVTPSGSVQALMIREAFALTADEIILEAHESLEFISPLLSSVDGNAGYQTISASVAVAPDGVSVAEASYSVAEMATPSSTEVDRTIPSSVSIEPNYPNPFNPSTIIPFSVEASGAATITVYDVLGRRVATLADRVFSAGSHAVSFDASEFQSGIYRVVLQFGVERTSRLIVLQK